MNKLTHQILILVLAMLLPLFCKGENSLTLTVNNNPVCQGTVVQFSATAVISFGTITQYKLLRNEDVIETINTNELTVNFSPITAENTANYKATVTYSSFRRATIESNTINLVVNQSVTTNQYVAACDEYTWVDEQTYTATTLGEHSWTYENVHGCDSTVYLYLTMYNTINYDQYVDACDEFTWVDGQIYTTTTLGEHTWTYGNASVHGCDSIVTLYLTMYNTVFYDQYAEACDEFTWVDGQTYTATTFGEHTWTYGSASAHDCDSVVRLYLTINHSFENEEVVSACGSYEWHGELYDESGYYTYQTQTVHGCDSIMHLNLTILQAPEIEMNGEDLVCDNSESVYTLTTGADDGLSYKWLVEGGSIEEADTTETITVRWNKNNTNGNVSVTVTNNITGCSAIVDKNVTIQTFVNEDVNKIVAKKNAQNIPYILIYPNPLTEYYYQWYKNDEPLEGENGQFLYLSDNTSTEIDSIYRVYVGHLSDGNSIICGKYSDYYTDNNQASQASLKIWPNPVYGNDNLVIYLNDINDYTMVKFYSPDGKIIFKGEITENPMKIQANYPKGLYIIEIINNQGNSIFEKVIIK